MGLFSSETKVSVGTSVSRVIKDANIPDSVKGAIAAAIYRGDDLIDSILEASTTAMGTKANLMYSYAEKKSPYGMPSGEVYSSTQGGEELQAVLNSLEGEPVLMEYRHFGGPNMIHMAWQILMNVYGYEPSTNKLSVLSTQKNTPVYLDDLVAELPSSEAAGHDPAEVEAWGPPPNSGFTPARPIVSQMYSQDYYTPTAAVFSPNVPVRQVRMKYVWESLDANGLKKLNHDEVVLALPIQDNTLEFFHVKYQAKGKTKFWMYQKDAGTYPELDDLFTGSPDVVGEFFPNLYFRLDRKRLGSNTSGAHYKATNKMAKYLGFDYDTIDEALHQNPDIGYVEQAFMTMAVPADTTEKVELRYLFGFFDQLYYASVDSPVQYSGTLSRWKKLFKTFQASRAISIKDAAFEMSLVHNGLFKVRKVGKVGEVGDVVMETGHISYTIQIQTSDPGAQPLSLPKSYRCRYYRKQITENFYEEIQVINLAMKYLIRGGHTTQLGDDGGEILLVPLDRGLLKEFNARDGEKLCARSLHIVCNSYVETKVKWYQQGWFSTVMLVVAVVATIASLGSASGPAAAAYAAVSAGAYMTAVYIIAMELLTMFIIQAAVKLFIKVAGVDIAFIASIVAAAYGVRSGMAAGSAAATEGMLTAQALLSVSTSLSQGINAEIRNDLKDLIGEYREFDSLKKEKIDLLESKLDLLKTDSILSPFVILGEKPGDLYKRTVHSGNIGTLVYADIHSYVDRSLKLPDFSDSVGGIKYAA